MSRSMRRRAAVWCAVATGIALTGAPNFMALDRAVSKIFLPEAPPPTAAPVIFEAAPFVPREQVLAPPIEAPPLALAAIPELPPRDAPTAPAADVRPAPARSSADRLLVPLYASFLALQALDVHSTLRALDRGAAESNPVMAPLTDRPTAFVALKAGSAAGIIYMSERVRRRSPLAATIMMVAFNSIYATVVTHNYGVGSNLAK